MARANDSLSMLCSARSIAAALMLGAALIGPQASADIGQDPMRPAGFPDKGRLVLLPGKSNQVLYYGTATATTVNATQTLQPLRRNDCRLSLPSTNRLLDFEVTGQGASPAVGLIAGSLGVFSGSQGTPCSRFATSLGQSLTVKLGPNIPADSSNLAFYALVLDIEAKANLAVEVQILRDGEVSDRYLLRTGNSIPSATSAGYDPGPDFPASRIDNCQAPKASDSGPDSGGLDNCRLVINQLGHGFRLVPKVGEGSLEGGADLGISTTIFLTEAIIGLLGCDSTNDDTDTLFFGQNVGKASCQVSRFDPSDIPNQTVGCTQPVGYILRSLNGSEEEGDGCELLKSPGEQIAAFIDIAFPPESRTALRAEKLTTIFFSTGIPDNKLTTDVREDLAEFTPERCIGTVVQDQNGNFSIAEVLQTNRPAGLILYKGAELSAINDPVPGNDTIEWACILDNAQYYLQKASPPLCDDSKNECMQVQQTILFWGDIRFSRE